MAANTLPRPSVSATGFPRRNSPTITLPLGNRRKIETAIEALIAVLDRLDGDPDLEPDADREPDTAATFCVTPAGHLALAEVFVERHRAARSRNSCHSGKIQIRRPAGALS